MKLLLTGGCGYIASHTAVLLLQQGHEVVLVDSLVNSYRQVVGQLEKITGTAPVFYEMELRDRPALRQVFLAHRFDAVLHFAALKAVGESIALPLRYYQNNVTGSLTLFEVMEEFKVLSLVFSSTAAVYGRGAEAGAERGLQVDSPTEPGNPYGKSKLMVEQLLADLVVAPHCWKVVVLRYFNPVGGHASGQLGELPKQAFNNLVPRLFQVALAQGAGVAGGEKLSVYGTDYPTKDGTGVRDYLHIMDLAEGHLLALQALKKLPGGRRLVYNLGTGRGKSVLEVLAEARRVTGKPLPYAVAPRRPGDVAYCYTDPTLAERELGFKARYSLTEMLASSWKFYQNYPTGYR